MLALIFDQMAPTLAAACVILDIAPDRKLANILRREASGLYLSCDFDPAADSRAVMLQADLTRMPLGDGCVDVMVCIHVLEHIPDDAAALREIHRLLAPGALAFISVPYRPMSVTDEDPSAPIAERVRRFGQADHVRYYGSDFGDRLHAADLGFAMATSEEMLGKELVYRFGLSPNEPFWFVWRGANRVAPGLPRFDTMTALAHPRVVESPPFNFSLLIKRLAKNFLTDRMIAVMRQVRHCRHRTPTQ